MYHEASDQKKEGTYAKLDDEVQYAIASEESPYMLANNKEEEEPYPIANSKSNSNSNLEESPYALATDRNKDPTYLTKIEEVESPYAIASDRTTDPTYARAEEESPYAIATDRAKDPTYMRVKDAEGPYAIASDLNISDPEPSNEAPYELATSTSSKKAKRTSPASIIPTPAKTKERSTVPASLAFSNTIDDDKEL